MPIDHLERLKLMSEDLHANIRYVGVEDVQKEISWARTAIIALQEEKGKNPIELRPMEEAPKDGTYILVVGTNFDGNAAVVQWDVVMQNWTLDDGRNPEIPLRAEHELKGWISLPLCVTTLKRS